jgi:hypothetical protein
VAVLFLRANRATNPAVAPIATAASRAIDIGNPVHAIFSVADNSMTQV